MDSLDPLFWAQSLLRRRKIPECIDTCTALLERNPYDKAAWLLKIRALVEEAYTDEAELDEEGMGELLMDDNATAQIPRPGTSFKRPLTNQGTSQGVRPLSKSGRPLTGFARPGTQTGRPTTMENAVRTARTATARPTTTASGRFVRLGTASMVSGDPGVFIDLAKLDLSKYASRPALAKALFQYMLYVANAPLQAMELAALATEQCGYTDWWWKAMLGLCYYRLSLYREAERQLLSAYKHTPSVLIALLQGKTYIRLDQPLKAIEAYETALQTFPGETTLIACVARVHEGVGNLPISVENYRKLLSYDSTNIEAIASLAADSFYNDQPEVAMLLYRRLLQMGVQSAELLNNLGLCCFYAQQYDLSLGCFERALSLAQSDEQTADVWYNIAHVGLALGDVSMAYQSLKLAIVCDPTHGEAYNNLGVLEYRKDNLELARGHYQSAIRVAAHMHEPHYNLALLSHTKGDLQVAFTELSSALTSFPDHHDSKALMQQITTQLISI